MNNKSLLEAVTKIVCEIPLNSIRKFNGPGKPYISTKADVPNSGRRDELKRRVEKVRSSQV